MGYHIWILEYAYIPDQPVGSILLGKHNAGTRKFPMTYSVLEGEGHKILVDVGMNNFRKNSLALLARDHITDFCPPEVLLGRVGMKPEEIDTIFITHAHLDHMGALDYFPNATTYLQRREFEGCKEALKLPKKYQSINKALNYEDIEVAEELLSKGKLNLVDGEETEFLPGISLYPEYDGHSFASQIVTVEGTDGERYVFTGDLIYSLENFNSSGDGSYIPVGLAVGTPMSLMLAMDDLLTHAGGRTERLIITHEPNNWKQYKSVCFEDGLHVATVC